MIDRSLQPTLRGELWLRDSVPAPTRSRQRRFRSRLDAIDVEATVRSMPRRIAVEDETAHRDLRSVLERCRDWTLERGATLAPAVSTRRCYDWTDGHRYEALVLPVAFLVVYEGSDVGAAYPHLLDGNVRTVMDGLAALERASTCGDPAQAATLADD